MGWGTKFIKIAAATYAAASNTAAALVITWSSNTPTASNTQTIADGTVPTVAELGQFAQNINTIMTAALVDIAALKTQVVALAADLAAARSALNEGE